MAILAIIAVIALGGYAYGFIKTRELSALRKEMKLYVDRMEAAELDLHAIRSVVWGGDRFCTVKNLGKNAGKADE
ncbi:TPA: hypothetical protein M4542_004399 [Salmonella enterica]|nr:hypothetical protein [Salmonella enterica]HCC3902544.1 hypothetical protein [Salmonella enterica]